MRSSSIWILDTSARPKQLGVFSASPCTTSRILWKGLLWETVIFEDGHVKEALATGVKTTLTAWFELNDAEPDGLILALVTLRTHKFRSTSHGGRKIDNGSADSVVMPPLL